jgi:hypothetical protein
MVSYEKEVEDLISYEMHVCLLKQISGGGDARVLNGSPARVAEGRQWVH